MSLGDEKGELHYIEEDTDEAWVEEWAAAGVFQFEVLLGQHAAFLAFLNLQQGTP